jgi:acyl carrier protein
MVKKLKVTNFHFYAVPNKGRENVSLVKLSSQGILSLLGKIIKTDLNQCNANDSLVTLGVDSLQAIEIQTVLMQHIQESISITKISTTTIGMLKALIESKAPQEAGPRENEPQTIASAP